MSESLSLSLSLSLSHTHTNLKKKKRPSRRLGPKLSLPIGFSHRCASEPGNSHKACIQVLCLQAKDKQCSAETVLSPLLLFPSSSAASQGRSSPCETTQTRNRPSMFPMGSVRCLFWLPLKPPWPGSEVRGADKKWIIEEMLPRRTV